jgi:hypothetical protein
MLPRRRHTPYIIIHTAVGSNECVTRADGNKSQYRKRVKHANFRRISRDTNNKFGAGNELSESVTGESNTDDVCTSMERCGSSRAERGVGWGDGRNHLWHSRHCSTRSAGKSRVHTQKNFLRFYFSLALCVCRFYRCVCGGGFDLLPFDESRPTNLVIDWPFV